MRATRRARASARPRTPWSRSRSPSDAPRRRRPTVPSLRTRRGRGPAQAGPCRCLASRCRRGRRGWIYAPGRLRTTQDPAPAGVGRVVLNVERLLAGFDAFSEGTGRVDEGEGGFGAGAHLGRRRARHARRPTSSIHERHGCRYGRGSRPSARRMCVGVGWDRDSVVYFPGFGRISSRETFADTRLICLTVNSTYFI